MVTDVYIILFLLSFINVALLHVSRQALSPTHNPRREETSLLSQRDIERD